MTDTEHTDAAAWRAIRRGSVPLVPPSIETPRAVVATAMARLREMRREAQLRVGTANHVQLTQPRNRI